MAFKALVENWFQHKIITLYSDNGGEFVALRPFLTAHGITHLTSSVHTLEHNGVAERNHRHVVKTGLTLLTQASMPASYWTYAFSTAVYLINRLSSSVLTTSSSTNHQIIWSFEFLGVLAIHGCGLTRTTNSKTFDAVCLHWIFTHTECISMSWSDNISHLYLTTCPVRRRELPFLRLSKTCNH